MKPTKAELIERHEQLLKLDDVLSEHEKTEHFDMGNWVVETECGTICCLAGHAGLQPWFRARGFKTKVFMGSLSQGVDDFFGNHAFEEIFDSRSSSVWPEAMQRVRDRLERIKAMPEEQT